MPGLGARVEGRWKGRDYTAWYSDDGNIHCVEADAFTRNGRDYDRREIWCRLTGKPPGPLACKVIRALVIAAPIVADPVAEEVAG